MCPGDRRRGGTYGAGAAIASTGEPGPGRPWNGTGEQHPLASASTPVSGNQRVALPPWMGWNRLTAVGLYSPGDARRADNHKEVGVGSKGLSVRTPVRSTSLVFRVTNVQSLR